MRTIVASMALVGAIACATLAAQSRPAEQSAADLARALQARYDTIKDFSTDFVHVYQGGVLKKRLTERGQLMVKKPGKMRWEYKSPEQKVFVSDGLKLYSYIPADKQVVVGSLPSVDTATTPALFLAGKGNLVRDFEVSVVAAPEGMPPDTKALKCVPKKAEQEYAWLVVSLDPVSLRIRGLMTTDAQGGTSTFSFSNLQENVGLADKSFEFKIPRGVDVVADSSPR
jgi:outer membrane lipoprotein carrier protein